MFSISLVAEEVFKIGGMPVTNSLLTGWVGIVLLILLVAIGMRKGSLVPTGLQLIFEAIYSFFLNLCESVLGDKKSAEKAVPFITTIFLFVFVANIFTVIPGVGTIGIKKTEAHVAEAAVSAEQSLEDSEAKEANLTPLFRPASADLNMTIALALVSVIVTQIIGFKTLGIGYLKKFFNFTNPINFFVGILELISEFAKIISFSFRLFGNIFAGEVLLAVILMLVPYFVPLPFYGLEIFVSIIQAFVFAMLTLVFIKLAMTSHDGEEHAVAR
ncbi:MAG: F0F1 ATP synthase subunit A [Nanoarchaeota archaeon]|nr:F0F1 ATP synthase subunit A [Nanoarchaeota archaeon]